MQQAERAVSGPRQRLSPRPAELVSSSGRVWGAHERGDTACGVGWLQRRQRRRRRPVIAWRRCCSQSLRQPVFAARFWGVSGLSLSRTLLQPACPATPGPGPAGATECNHWRLRGQACRPVPAMDTRWPHALAAILPDIIPGLRRRRHGRVGAGRPGQHCAARRRRGASGVQLVSRGSAAAGSMQGRRFQLCLQRLLPLRLAPQDHQQRQPAGRAGLARLRLRRRLRRRRRRGGDRLPRMLGAAVQPCLRHPQGVARRWLHMQRPLPWRCQQAHCLQRGGARRGGGRPASG